MILIRFMKLMQNLNFVDVISRDPTSKDTFWKICVHEPMVPFKGRWNVKQYMYEKLTQPMDIIFAICGKSCLIYDFPIYQGATIELDEIEKGVFGLAGVVVSKLSQRISEKNVALFVDNYFSNKLQFAPILAKPRHLFTLHRHS
jgi:hypothetical protein